MTRSLTFYYEFASTYSYLSAMRIAPLGDKAGVKITWKPFLLGPIFHAQGWDTSPFNLYPAKGAYMWRDMARRLAELALPPLTKPDPFPQNGLLAARIATLGAEDGWGPAYTRAVYSAQFAEGRPISDPEVLAGLLAGVGQDGPVIIEQAKTDQANKDALRQATEDAVAAGIFGAPSFVTPDGELFWGDDRLEAALSWAATGGHPPAIA